MVKAWVLVVLLQIEGSNGGPLSFQVSGYSSREACENTAAVAEGQIRLRQMTAPAAFVGAFCLEVY